jgi:hypothetical protein
MLSSGWFTSVCSLNANISEMLAFKLQMPVNNPQESIKHSEHGESLKSRIHRTVCGVSSTTHFIFLPFQQQFALPSFLEKLIFLLLIWNDLLHNNG